MSIRTACFAAGETKIFWPGLGGGCLRTPNPKTGFRFFMRILKIKDSNGQELEMYENDKGLLYLQIEDSDNDPYTSQYITIDFADAVILRDELNSYINHNG